jgi:hypothetical protein
MAANHVSGHAATLGAGKRSVGGPTIDRLKESSSLENVNRLRDLRLDKLPFAGRLVFAGLIIHTRLAVLILILIYQDSSSWN